MQTKLTKSRIFVLFCTFISHFNTSMSVSALFLSAEQEHYNYFLWHFWHFGTFSIRVECNFCYVYSFYCVVYYHGILFRSSLALRLLLPNLIWHFVQLHRAVVEPFPIHFREWYELILDNTRTFIEPFSNRHRPLTQCLFNFVLHFCLDMSKLSKCLFQFFSWPFWSSWSFHFLHATFETLLSPFHSQHVFFARSLYLFTLACIFLALACIFLPLPVSFQYKLVSFLHKFASCPILVQTTLYIVSVSFYFVFVVGHTQKKR